MQNLIPIRPSPQGPLDMKKSKDLTVAKKYGLKHMDVPQAWPILR